jgi:signal transduction histidine kinase
MNPKTLSEKLDSSETSELPLAPPDERDTEAPGATRLDDLENWRRRVFQFVIFLTIGFGFPPLIAWSLSKTQQGRPGIMLPMWGVYALLVTIAFARTASFRARAGIFLACLFAAGGIAIVEYGFRGQGPVMFLAVVTMTVVFMGFREGVVAFVFALLLIGVTSLLFLHERLEDNAKHALTAVAPWISLIATFLMVGTSMLAAVGVLMRRLETGLATERGLVKDLRREVQTAETARAETLRELGERLRAEEALEQRDRVLHAVGFAAQKLLKSRRWEDCAEEVVRSVGEAAGMERATLAEVVCDPKRGELVRLRFRWAAPGLAERPVRQNLSERLTALGLFRELVATLRKGEPIRVEQETLSGDAREIAEEISAAVATMLPIVVDDELWGFIGLSSSDPSLEISEQIIDLLRAAAGSLGAAIGRDRLNAELEARVTERTERLARANEEIEAFSYSISHDLRAPLRHVSAYVGMLRAENGAELPQKAGERLKVIGDAAERMTRMIDDLLQFYRLGRASFASTELDLGRVVAEVIAEYEHETKIRDVQWNVGTLPGLHADRALMKHVFSNLIGNALKYTSSRSHAEIAVGQEASDGELVLYVRDNGVGFDPSQTHRLFHVFQRLHPLHDFEGNGIGLAHVKRIVERHGGRVWAKGAVDAGATFYLAFPLNAPPA